MKTLYLQHRYYSILLTTLFICCRASLIRYERMRALLKASSKNAEKCKCMRGQHATNCEKEMGAGSRQWANSELTPHARLASTGLMVWASSSNIKANLVIENRSRVHPPQSLATREHSRLLDGALRGCCAHACFWWQHRQANHTTSAAAVQQFVIFILKIHFRHWRGQKATSNIWKEFLLVISFFYEILQQNAWGDVGSKKNFKRAVAF